MNAAWSQADLRNFKASSFAQKDVFLGNTHIGEPDMHVTARRVVFAKHLHAFKNLNTGCIDRYEDL